MIDIKTLSTRKAEAMMFMQTLGMMNTAIKSEDRLRQAAQYEIAHRAYIAAARDFDKAIAGLTTDELILLSKS
jgi:hypothetical protein